MLACSTDVIFLCFSGDSRQSQSKRGVPCVWRSLLALRLPSLAWKPWLTWKSHLDGSWILSKFFLHIYSPRWSQGQLKYKKERRHYSHLDQTNLVNSGFIAVPKRELFPAGPTREIPSGQDGSINSFTRIFFLLYVCLCSSVWSSFILSLKSIGIAFFCKCFFFFVILQRQKFVTRQAKR